MSASPFITRCSKAVADKRLQRTLASAQAVFRANRARGMKLFPHFEQHRDTACAVRMRCLENLPAILERLEERIVEASGTVHWARTGAEANAIIADIARLADVKKVVKGKSMVTEETGLNDALAAAGVEAVETDLGEYIVQLAEEPPSHIVAPAAHKDRHEVSQLFHEHLGEPVTDDIPEMTLMARRALRKKFLEADMGITGANVLVAETGSVVLVENEGNIRMSTTVPRIHVAVAGIDKAVATLDDMTALLSLLPRSCTGQALSSYTSWLTGSRRLGEEDGAHEFHLVLIDNGRSRLLSIPELRPVLSCIRCGACVNVCPVYARIGGHSYGSPYSGPMGALLAPLLAESDGKDTRDNPFAALPFACTSCGACKEVCPVRIDHTGLLQKLRERYAAAASPMPRHVARGARLIMEHPGFYRAAMNSVRRLDPELKIAQRLPKIGKTLTSWIVKRQLPRFKTPFSARWKRIKRNSGGQS